MKILMTGGAGYVGSFLVNQLLRKKHKLIIIDSLLYGGESIVFHLSNPDFQFYNFDIRDYKNMEKIFKTEKNIDVVIHLAAISSEQGCRRFPEEALEINYNATRNLVDISLKHNIKKFIYASTCSNYGKSGKDFIADESSKLNPISLYAETKVNSEKYILEIFKKRAIILRFATIYGLSPRMRFDLTINDFTREFLEENELLIYGENFNRPYCHISDIAKSIKLFIEKNDNKFQIYNVGNSDENYSKKELVKILLKYFPNGRVKYIKKDDDPRDYMVNFDRIKGEGFTTNKKIIDGIEEIINSHRLFKNIYDKNYMNRC